jgi:hypothetical protein
LWQRPWHGGKGPGPGVSRCNKGMEADLRKLRDHKTPPLSVPKAQAKAGLGYGRGASAR